MKQLAKNNVEEAIAFYWQGLGEYNVQKYTEATTHLSKAVELNPTYAAPYATLTAVEYQKQDFTKGLEYAQKCVDLDPKYACCHNNLAIAYINLGQKDKALEEMQKAVNLDPDSFAFQDNFKRMKVQ